MGGGHLLPGHLLVLLPVDVDPPEDGNGLQTIFRISLVDVLRAEYSLAQKNTQSCVVKHKKIKRLFFSYRKEKSNSHKEAFHVTFFPSPLPIS